jgi:Plasmid encoded RepA protein
VSEPSTIPGQTDLLAAISEADLAKLNLATEIETVDARTAGSVGFLPRLAAQVSMFPYRNPGDDVPVWTRVNGNVSLTVTPANFYGPDGLVQKRLYPYGAYPRVLMVSIAGKVKKTGERTLPLGASMGELMRDLNLPRGGVTRAALREQITRLAGATIEVRAHAKAGNLRGETRQTFKVASKIELWWTVKDTDDDQLMPSTITLSEEFYNSILADPLPIDMRALAYLRRQGTSGLPIDIYVWLAYRMHGLSQTGKSQHISWDKLQRQFGSQYKLLRQFKAKFLEALPKVLAAYPWAREGVVVTDGGLLLYPTRPPILPKGRKW